MRKIKDILGQQVSGQYAFEVEVTGAFHKWGGASTSRMSNAGWRLENDGSIGGGLEFVCHSPASMEDTSEKLRLLYEELRGQDIDFEGQERAGVHLHVNVQEWNAYQLLTFVTLYYIFEEVLVDWCGEHRVGNHFCLRVKDAEYLLVQLKTALEKRDLYDLNSTKLRYSALNFCSLFKYGSLEFRSMRTAPCHSYLVRWMEMIDKLVEFSKRYDNPLSLLEYLSPKSMDTCMEEVFGEYLSRELYTTEVDNKMREGWWVAQEIAHSTHWGEKTSVTTNPFRAVFDEKRGEGSGWKF